MAKKSSAIPKGKGLGIEIVIPAKGGAKPPAGLPKSAGKVKSSKRGK